MYHFKRIDWEKVWCAVIIILVSAFLIGGCISLLTGCAEEPERGCYECIYHDQVLTFCEMTQERIDSLEAVFNTGCKQDSLKCKIIKP